LIEELELEYANPDDPVFTIVPPAFGELISAAYRSIGSPTVTFHSFWNIYEQLHQALEHGKMPPETVHEISIHARTLEDIEHGHGIRRSTAQGPTAPLTQEVQFGEDGIPNLIGGDSEDQPRFQDDQVGDQDDRSGDDLGPGSNITNPAIVQLKILEGYFSDEDMDDLRKIGTESSIPAVDFTDDIGDELY
jgi:hypothetical protein